MECEREPDHEITLKGVTAKVWINSCIDGNVLTTIRMTQTRSDLRDATMFTRDELPIVAWLACAAFDWITQQDAERCLNLVRQ